MKLLIAFLFLFTSAAALGAPAKATSSKNVSSKAVPSAPRKPRAPTSRAAIVKIDSAMVYDIPSFDGAVISYLPAGQKVRISLRTYSAGLGKFYRIVLPNKKAGYIADIDVQPLKSKKKSSNKSGDDEEDEDESQEQKKERLEEAREEREDAARNAQRAPVALTEWIGPYIASWNFKEKISGVDAEERLTVFGLKYTSPKLLVGAILDLNVGFHFGAPTYYEQVSTAKPKGYLLFIDAEFLSPMIIAQNSFGYFGLGPLINYTAIRIESVNTPVDSNDLRLGLALTLGYSHRIGPVLGKLEGKYIVEKANQTVFLLSIQSSL